MCDIASKNFEVFPDAAANLTNALLYGGRLLVAAGRLLSAPTEGVYQGREALRNQLEDVSKCFIGRLRLRKEGRG